MKNHPLHGARSRDWGHRLTAPALVAACAWGLTACSPGPIDIAGIDSHSPLFGMLAHWPFDEGGGNVATDRSGHGFNGTIAGATRTAGQFGGALHFEFGNEVVVRDFPAAKAAFSIALWVRVPPGIFGDSYLTLISTEVPFDLGQSAVPGGGWQMNVMLSPIEVKYQFAYWRGPGVGDYFLYDCHCVVPDKWTHLAGVVDVAAGTLSLYKDGLYQGQTPVTDQIRAGSSALYMGRWLLPGRLFTGDLDDVVIYDRALAASEVAALAKAPAPVVP